MTSATTIGAIIFFQWFIPTPPFAWSFLYVNLQRFVYFVRDILPVFLPLPHALRQEILDLSVDRPEVVLRPRCDRVVQLCGKSERHLFFARITHSIIPLIKIFNKDFLSSRSAAHRGFRRALPADWTPSQPCAPRRAPQCGSR